MKKQQRELARWRQRYERAEQKLDITTQVRCIERALACVQAGGEDADNFWGERIRLLFWAALQALAQGRGKRLIELLRYFDPDRLDQINLFRGYRRYVGQAYLAMGQGERAAAELRAYLQKYPDDEEARIYLARACGELPRGERPWLLPVGDYTPAEVRQFPVFINVRDRLAGLQRLVTWLQRQRIDLSAAPAVSGAGGGAGPARRAPAESRLQGALAERRPAEVGDKDSLSLYRSRCCAGGGLPAGSRAALLRRAAASS